MHNDFFLLLTFYANLLLLFITLLQNHTPSDRLQSFLRYHYEDEREMVLRHSVMHQDFYLK